MDAYVVELLFGGFLLLLVLGSGAILSAMQLYMGGEVKLLSCLISE